MTTNALVGPDGQATQGSIDLRNNTITMRDAQTGQLVTMDLAPSDVHIPSALPMYAAGYKLQESIADQAAPVVVVPKASDKFFTWGQDNAFQRVESLVTPPGGQIPEVSMTLSSTLFTTVEYTLGSFVATELEANADAPLKPKMKAMNRILAAQRLEREIRTMTLLTTSANWDSSVVTALAATFNWNGGSASDPIKDIDTIMENSRQPVTGMVMNRRVWNTFRRNSQVQKYIQYKADVPGLPASSADLTKGNALLSLPKNIYVSDMKYKTSTGTYDYVWPDKVVFLHEIEGVPADGETIATAKTFRWSGGVNPDSVTPAAAGDGMMFGGWLVREFYDPKRGGRAGSMLVTVVNDIEVLTGSVVGGLITGVIA